MNIVTKNTLKDKVFFKKVSALRVGFEPTANRLTADCSTAELPENVSVPFWVHKYSIIETEKCKTFK